MNAQRDIDLIDELTSHSTEMPWLEFKSGLSDPKQIGKLVSALSNAARLDGKQTAFLVWGVKDGTHEIVGTSFDPNQKKVGNQVFELWLRNKLSPPPAFRFRKVEHPDGQLVLLEIPAPTAAPTAFEGVPYIRVGSATPKLSDDPHRYQALIEMMRPYTWETGVALNYVSGEQVLTLLDYGSYFELTGQPTPGSCEQVLEKLRADRLIEEDVGGRWNILNLGAMLFANDLRRFGSSLQRKGVRFIRYDGRDRTATVTHRHDEQRGYASGFQSLLSFVNGLLPQNEHIGEALRQAHPLFPALSVRELIANALTHQDMTVTGAGPMIELFSDRLEVTNPGAPLIETNRMVDHPPRSRNEALASLLRRMGMCEEQGSGLDKVFAELEFCQLPAPLLKASDSAMQVVLYGPRSFAEMSMEERVRACYWHTVLRYVSGDRMRNAGLCARLGVERHNAAQASVVIRKTMDAGLIRYADPDHPRAGYIPIWA